MSTNEIEIYISLLNEGTDVLRPTTGLVVEPNVLRVITTRDYNPDVEEWEFVPGRTVPCVKELRGGREVLVARDRVA